METNIIVCRVLGWLVWNRVRRETIVSRAGLVSTNQGEDGN